LTHYVNIQDLEAALARIEASFAAYETSDRLPAKSECTARRVTECALYFARKDISVRQINHITIQLADKWQYRCGLPNRWRAKRASGWSKWYKTSSPESFYNNILNKS
jgi:hypothetical protein